MDGARILVVDDDPVFLAVTMLVLQKQGHVCRGAKDAHEALEILSADPHDILIADREMPGNDRFALLHKLPPSCQAMPIIVVTGYPTVDSAIDAMSVSVVAYMVKPVVPEELVMQVGRAVELLRVRNLVNASRDQSTVWQGQLRELESAVRGFPNDAVTGGAQALLAVNLDHLESVLEQVRQCAAIAAEKGQGAGGPAGLRSEEQLALLQGVRETIAVLEKTKSSFKSSELGKLRRKLDSLFRAPAP